MLLSSSFEDVVKLLRVCLNETLSVWAHSGNIVHPFEIAMFFAYSIFGQ